MMLMNEPLSFVKLIEASDIMIRPTQTDGDALSVREALFLGKAVLASDVVSRPEGTSLYQKNNAEDLYNKTVELIGQIRSNVAKADNMPGQHQDYFQFYDQLFKQILNR